MPPLHNQSAKNILDISPRRGIIKGPNKTWKSINFSIIFVLKSKMS